VTKVAHRYEKRGAVVLPLYGFEHTDTALSTVDFGDRWDSGQIGFVYAFPGKAKKFAGWTESGEALRARLAENMASEVSEIGRIMNGEVYGYTIEDEDGNQLDSLWGMVGYEYAESQMREAAAGFASERLAADPALAEGEVAGFDALVPDADDFPPVTFEPDGFPVGVQVNELADFSDLKLDDETEASPAVSTYRPQSVVCQHHHGDHICGEVLTDPARMKSGLGSDCAANRCQWSRRARQLLPVAASSRYPGLPRAK
jgi:hypothetical protein